MKAKTGRQYILQSSASALWIFCLSLFPSAQEITTLQRVVTKRPGEGRRAAGSSGVTRANHLVYVIFSKQ
jgi:hypothetical protein